VSEHDKFINAQVAVTEEIRLKRKKMSRHIARNLGALKLTPLCLTLQNFVGVCVGILTARHVTLVPASIKAGKFVNKSVKKVLPLSETDVRIISG
jgi:hypothetical protein